MINYCIPTLKCFDLCAKSIDAVMRGSLMPHAISVIDNSGAGDAEAHLYHCGIFNRYSNVRVIHPDRNLGVAGSWNRFMQDGDEFTIIANDDIEVHLHTIWELVHTAQSAPPNQVFFAGSGYSGNAFSLFLLLQRGYEIVGPFDERFYPAYFEDNDYYRRMKMHGFDITTVQAATYDHVGSSTLRAYTPVEQEEHHKAFRKNQMYYQWKWGGIVGEETRTEPQTL